MDKLPCCGGPPVREQTNDGLSHGFGVGRFPAQRRLASPLAFDLLEAADAFRGERFDRARRDEVDPDAASPQVAGEVARGALQGGFGHPHPIVGRPGDPGVEVQTYDGSSVGENVSEADGQGFQRIGRGLKGRGDGRPFRREEVAAEGVLGSEGDGVYDPVEGSPAPVEILRHRGDVFWLVYVELEDGWFGVEAFGRSFREAFGAAEAAQYDLRTLL